MAHPAPAPQAGTITLPVIPLKEAIFFPLMVLPVAIGRERSMRALDAASSGLTGKKGDPGLEGRKVFIVAQKSAVTEDPGPGDLAEVGTVGEIAQIFKLPDGTVRVFIQGLFRARRIEYRNREEGFLEAVLAPFLAPVPPQGPETEAIIRSARRGFAQYLDLNPNVRREVGGMAGGIEDPDKLADLLSAHIALKTEDKQCLLEMANPLSRLEKICGFLAKENEVLLLERKIQSRVRGQIEKSQKEFFLQEQMKAIQKELRQKDDRVKDVEELRTKAAKIGLSKEAATVVERELSRLEKIAPFSPEAGVAQTYIDWILALPWSIAKDDQLDLDKAARVLDEDHFGLEKPKERIMEHLAVCALKKNLRGPILCFVGPPGSGKTSLARSIARALGRDFTRMSLGGMRDESEIRGHRRTYIGAMPGRLIQQLKRCGSNNPVFLLDELDKMGSDWRGDPAAALLEVLDPEQNNSFADHYLDVGFDLSRIFFIATANSMFSIPPTLRDRLEVIRFSDYTPLEKREITRRYLIPKQIEEQGLGGLADVEFSNEALDFMIERYTREAGVRQLNRELAKVTRKIARETAGKHSKKPPGGEAAPGRPAVKVRRFRHSEDILKYLGVPPFSKSSAPVNSVGVVTGLAWTEAGGDVLMIEAALVSGKGELRLTGKLGETMQESAQAAFSYIRSSSARIGLEFSGFKAQDIHLHVPEGAVPKDGPSAGGAMALCLASLLAQRAVAKGLAMTGEITLTGKLLPVGGIREKLIAAHRYGVRRVIIPVENKKDLEDVPKEILRSLEIIPLENMDEAMKLALAKERE